MSLRTIMNGLGKVNLNMAPAGKDLFGTVVKKGVNDKTVTVKVTSQSWNSKYRSLFYKTTDFQVHDEENYCVVGDKVVISRVKKFTPTKYYYVRNIVKAFPREDFYKVESPLEDKDTLKEFEKYKKDIFLSELGRSPIMSRKQVAELKKNAKAKAILKINDYIRKKEKAKSA